MRKGKTANFIMVLAISVIVSAGIGLAFYLQKGPVAVMRGGISASFTDSPITALHPVRFRTGIKSCGSTPAQVLAQLWAHAGSKL